MVNFISYVTLYLLVVNFKLDTWNGGKFPDLNTIYNVDHDTDHGDALSYRILFALFEGVLFLFTIDFKTNLTRWKIMKCWNNAN